MIGVMHASYLEGARTFAERLATDAATIALSFAEPTHFTRKHDNTPVTQADHDIQRMIATTIAERYPEHSFLGEETIDKGTARPASSQEEFCWVVDPIDGTRNFTKRFPITATSIALMRGDEPVVGVIREHHSGWSCSVVRGGPLLCQGRPARVSERPIDADTLIAVPSGQRQIHLPAVGRWLDRHVLRNVGSTALHMAYVAMGAVDAMICDQCKLWDVAAGWLMITTAGGRCVDLTGRPMTLPTPADYAARSGHAPYDFPFFAASPAVFDRLFDDVRA